MEKRVEESGGGGGVTFLTSKASCTLNCVANLSRTALASAEKGGTSMTWGMRESCCSQRHSTATRKRMRPYSLKMLRRPSTLEAYLLQMDPPFNGAYVRRRALVRVLVAKEKGEH